MDWTMILEAALAVFVQKASQKSVLFYGALSPVRPLPNNQSPSTKPFRTF
jgi:hypothetical protein